MILTCIIWRCGDSDKEKITSVNIASGSTGDNYGLGMVAAYHKELGTFTGEVEEKDL